MVEKDKGRSHVMHFMGPAKFKAQQGVPARVKGHGPPALEIIVVPVDGFSAGSGTSTL